jgi:hypothetical protein
MSKGMISLPFEIVDERHMKPMIVFNSITRVKDENYLVPFFQPSKLALSQ